MTIDPSTGATSGQEPPDTSGPLSDREGGEDGASAARTTRQYVDEVQYWLHELAEASIDRGRLAASRGLLRLEIRVALVLLGASIVVAAGVLAMQGLADILTELLEQRWAGRLLAAAIAVAAVLLAIIGSQRRERSRIGGKWRRRHEPADR
ncbi:MAG: hypothetical protein PVF43_16420 [Candidatus Eiseniibacteriota bacterium]